MVEYGRESRKITLPAGISTEYVVSVDQ